jgi:hypothetical protein
MAMIYITLSAVITALSNFMIRRGIDRTEGAKGDPFIIYRFLTAALIAIPIIYLQHGIITVDSNMSVVAIAAGLALGLLQYAIGRSLQYGPAALSFIFVSSVSVLPPVIMFFLFGEEFGHGYSIFNLFGSLLVLAGLYWMGATQGQGHYLSFKKWLLWISVACGSGVLYQSILQWRALLLKLDLPDSPLLPFHCDTSRGDVFMVVTFIVAAMCQMLFKDQSENQTFSKHQIFFCGIIAGVFCGISSFLLLLGTEFAITNTAKAIIFPLNTVLLISLCNSWAKAFYEEKVNWPANALCAIGIIIGSW